jgi:hypothetical protein
VTAEEGERGRERGREGGRELTEVTDLTNGETMSGSEAIKLL